MYLRKFIPADREEFLSMCADFYSTGAALEPIPESHMEKTFDAAVSGSPHVMGFIMEQEGACAGYGLVYPFYSNESGGLCLMLDEIYVKPDFRGQGLGRAYLETVAAASGLSPVALKLEICPKNLRARKLYESSGFSILGYDSMIKAL